ncbi:MAG: HAMP domain-containing protein [Alphaproteobacteria bacterium]|nr:HAMP domain-containing protein [Alphaproteobacteria bacterium]
MKYFIKHPFKALKAYLPKSMFGRTLMILMAPLVLVGTLSAYIFFDNHWDHVTNALANTLAGEIATLTALYNASPENQPFYNTLAGVNFKTRTNFIPKGHLNPTLLGKSADPFLMTALQKKIFTPYTLEITKGDIIIKVEVKDGLLEFVAPRKRFLSKTFYLFIIWVGLTSAIFLLIASIFMHNQVKPLRRLAIAADRFGKGRSFPDFKPEGATEIRKVTRAFLDMKARLNRQLTQRLDMLSGVSHDLRTPLTRMQLQLAMMPPSAEVTGLQKDIDEMSQMLEGYLTFARGEGLEETSETPMNSLLLDAIEGRAQLTTPIHYNPTSLPSLHVKPQALKRCLTNLINNATRYGHEVWVNAQANTDSLIISVEDNGPGIPEEKLQEVFKPFFRLDRSRNTNTGGVGLGLTIARDIAQSHGGDIQLTPSKNHEGLCASLILPL